MLTLCASTLSVFSINSIHSLFADIQNTLAVRPTSLHFFSRVLSAEATRLLSQDLQDDLL